MEVKGFNSFKEWQIKSKEMLMELKNCESSKIRESLCKYIACRYMLERIPEVDEELYDLANESLSLMTKKSKEMIIASEELSGCTGAKSAAAKKVLLCLSISKIFEGGEPEENEFVGIKTIKDLEEYVRLRS
ncbi:MAG: hypothetical protein K6B15_06380 [Parasporobacterium sp.]|nr:hypothetical protein [Parasporobacterium sp.]